MSADAWFDALTDREAPLRALRALALDCGLAETIKWRQPCYTDAGRNVIILGQRADHCVLSFFKGALLDDPTGLLEDAGPNTRSAKVVRISEAAEVQALGPALRALIAQAVAVTRAGKTVPRPTEPPAWAPELQAHLAENTAFREAFQALTPGRQRAYNLHIAQAKQPKTRVARIARCTPRILAGKGLNDCICGRTKRPPGCDGSHRHAP